MKTKLTIWGPKKADHPSVGEPCPVCAVPFVAGDLTSPVNNAPADAKQRAKMIMGLAYTASCQEAHAHCARIKEKDNTKDHWMLKHKKEDFEMRRVSQST